MNYYILYLVSLLICNIFTSTCLSRYSLSLYLLFLQLSSYCNIELGLFWLDSRLMVSWGLLRNKHRNTRVGIFADFKLIRFFITFGYGPWGWEVVMPPLGVLYSEGSEFTDSVYPICSVREWCLTFPLVILHWQTRYISILHWLI